VARGRKLRSREPRHPPRPTILLVVDEILIRLVLAEHLESCGFTVINASNGLEAIRLLLEPDCPVELVFSDVRKSGAMDGVKLTQWISGRRPQIPLILASAETDKTRIAINPCGAHLLAKPYSLNGVVEQARNLVRAQMRVQ